MKGNISVTVQNNRVQFKFTLRRNLTILRGESATGKTALIEMIAAFEANHESGIIVNCDKQCRVIYGEHWSEQLSVIRDSIVFIDEGNKFVKSKEFAGAIKDTDNYYVIATREPLSALPYSVEEVYGIVNKTRCYGRIKRIYSGFKNLYGGDYNVGCFDTVVVEDSNAGFEFFSSAFDENKYRVVSAKGKSNIANTLLKLDSDCRVLVIADGAAFGPEMEPVIKAGMLRNVSLYLPESFEYIILKSGIIEEENIKSILDDPSEFIESREYFSWEQFFYYLLSASTRGTYLEYNKKKLNPVYLQEKEKKTSCFGVSV